MLRTASCHVVDVESDDPPPTISRTFVFSEIDVDAEDEDIGFADYCNDIYDNMRSNELKHHVCADYIEEGSRVDVSHKMRAVLVDWLVEVCEEYSLTHQSLFLAINLLDAFLRHNSISRKLLQLLGVSCMLIASKFEEIHPPTAAEFSYITDYTFTTREVVETEEIVLRRLHYQVARVTSWEFRRRFILALDNDQTSMSLISYILELSLQFPLVLRYLPSIVSAAATSLALLSLNKPQWTRELVRNSGYEYSDIRPCIVELHEMMQKVSKLTPSKSKAVTKKYRERCHHFVGNLEPPNFIP